MIDKKIKRLLTEETITPQHVETLLQDLRTL